MQNVRLYFKRTFEDDKWEGVGIGSRRGGKGGKDGGCSPFHGHNENLETGARDGENKQRFNLVKFGEMIVQMLYLASPQSRYVTKFNMDNEMRG